MWFFLCLVICIRYVVVDSLSIWQQLQGVPCPRVHLESWTKFPAHQKMSRSVQRAKKQHTDLSWDRIICFFFRNWSLIGSWFADLCDLCGASPVYVVSLKFLAFLGVFGMSLPEVERFFFSRWLCFGFLASYWGFGFSLGWSKSRNHLASRLPPHHPTSWGPRWDSNWRTWVPQAAHPGNFTWPSRPDGPDELKMHIRTNEVSLLVKGMLRERHP